MVCKTIYIGSNPIETSYFLKLNYLKLYLSYNEKSIIYINYLYFFGSSFVLTKVQINNSSSTITFNEHIAPIFYANCTGCHHNGGVGPFLLIDYQDSYNMRNAIQSSVLSGYMPPWPPDTNYSRFRHERILSDQEINLINDWISFGAPEGNPSLAPTPPPTIQVVHNYGYQI